MLKIIITIFTMIIFYFIIFIIYTYANICNVVQSPITPLMQLKLDSQKRIFPFRYFQDNNNNILPYVAVTGFFRDREAFNKYFEYINNGIHVFGITAYKTFPNEITDGTEGSYINNMEFAYTKHIKNWLCCFNDPQNYGFTDDNNILVMSESDFYDVTVVNDKKIYDFIYICLNDNDYCPLNGWNAINRNFNLALKCFDIMVNEYGLKGLVVGRVGCGLETKYPNIEVVDMLNYHVLQEKMAQSKFLFIPNINDASPRVVSECLIKNVPVLMNQNILCGSKYINYETGEFFNDEHDIKNALNNLLNKINNISPTKWWTANYGKEISETKLCSFLNDNFDNKLNVNKVKFIL